jgi:hypothetical protein
MNEDRLRSLNSEIERQDREFQAFAETLTALGEAEVAVPHEVLEDLDAATKPITPAAPPAGIRV